MKFIFAGNGKAVNALRVLAMLKNRTVPYRKEHYPTIGISRRFNLVKILRTRKRLWKMIEVPTRRDGRNPILDGGVVDGVVRRLGGPSALDVVVVLGRGHITGGGRRDYGPLFRLVPSPLDSVRDDCHWLPVRE